MNTAVAISIGKTKIRAEVSVQQWKETRDANFTGSAGAIEPQGTLKLFS